MSTALKKKKKEKARVMRHAASSEKSAMGAAVDGRRVSLQLEARR
jgi:hypothetical protein